MPTNMGTPGTKVRLDIGLVAVVTKNQGITPSVYVNMDLHRSSTER
jgi:hypothetical protein